MRCYFVVFFLLIFSVAGITQSQHWNLYVNKTKMLSASIDTLQEYRLPKATNGVIKFSFPGRSKEFIRTVIIMNEHRNNIMEKDLKTSCKTASFRIDSLLSKTAGQPFVIYIRDIPADPKKAMLVRVAPMAICNISWKE